MRIPLALAAFLILFSSSVWAGKRITLEVVDPATNKTTTREMLLDADRVRVNDGDRSMMFLTKGGNRLVVLDKTRNEFREIDQATMEQMAGAVQTLMTQLQGKMKGMTPEQQAAMAQLMGRGAAAPATPQVTFTAKGPGTVNGFRCTNYDGVRGSEKVIEICAAQPSELKLTTADFQVLQRIQEFANTMLNSLRQSPLAAMVPVDEFMPKGINGYPVQTINLNAGQPGVRSSVKSVAEVALSDTDFSTGNAKKVEMPMAAIGGRGKGK